MQQSGSGYCWHKISKKLCARIPVLSALAKILTEDIAQDMVLDSLGVDSLDMIEFIVNIEDEFNLGIPAGQVASETLTRRLLVRHRLPATLAKLRIIGRRPPLAVSVTSWRKMYRSDSRGPGQIDNLYSEFLCIP
jgi:acyl carrier protein